MGFKVALENAPAGGDINTAYAAKDNVLIATLAPGDKAYVRVAASAAAIARADFVQTHTDGTVLKGTASNGIGIAQEAVDNSSNSASEAFYPRGGILMPASNTPEVAEVTTANALQRGGQMVSEMIGNANTLRHDEWAEWDIALVDVRPRTLERHCRPEISRIGHQSSRLGNDIVILRADRRHACCRSLPRRDDRV